MRRLRLLEAARDLFLERGFGGTTIEAIAEAAGVAQPTVYAAFGSKAGLLKHLVDVSVGGDDEDVTMDERPEALALLAVDDLPARMEAMAALAHEVHARSAPLLRLVASVSGSDPALGQLAADLRRQIRQSSRGFVAALPPEALRPDLTTDEAVELFALYGSPDTWSALVTDAGWTGERYSAWLADVVVRTLLRSA